MVYLANCQFCAISQHQPCLSVLETKKKKKKKRVAIIGGLFCTYMKCICFLWCSLATQSIASVGLRMQGRDLTDKPRTDTS